VASGSRFKKRGRHFRFVYASVSAAHVDPSFSRRYWKNTFEHVWKAPRRQKKARSKEWLWLKRLAKVGHLNEDNWQR
jgi:hypothetical protein